MRTQQLLAFLSLLFEGIAPALAQADAPAELADRIRSAEEHARVRAANELIKVHAEAIDRLIAILDRPTSPSNEWLNPTTPENLAIRVLGEMRAAKAVPTLIPWLGPPEGGHFIYGDIPPGGSPAGMALAAIGKPAEAPLINVLRRSPKTPAWEHSLAVLQKIEGRAVLLVILKEAVTAEKYPEAKSNLAEALRRLEVGKGSKK